MANFVILFLFRKFLFCLFFKVSFLLKWINFDEIRGVHVVFVLLFGDKVIFSVMFAFYAIMASVLSITKLSLTGAFTLKFNFIPSNEKNKDCNIKFSFV